MTVFWITLGIVFIFSLLGRYYASPVLVHGDACAVYKPNIWLSGAALAILVLVAGLRSNIGDTGAYMHSFTLLGKDVSQVLGGGDFGFNVLQVLLKNITDNPQVLVFTTSLMTNSLIFYALYRFADPFEIGTYLYITTGCYLVTMNGIRQYLGAAILFAAVKLLMDGKWKQYFLVVLLASTMHTSALIMLPVYFVVRRKAWSIATVCIMVPAMVGFVFFDEMISVVFTVLQDTQYGHYREYFAQAGHGANILRALIAAAPLVLAYMKRKELKEQWRESDVFANLCLLDFLFMLFSTYNWILARFSIYFGLYNLVLLSRLIKTCKGREKALLYYLVIFCYFIYFYFEQVISLNVVYRSDYLNRLLPFLGAS